MYTCTYTCLYKSEVNDSNDTRNGKKEMGRFLNVRYLCYLCSYVTLYKKDKNLKKKKLIDMQRKDRK